MARRSTTSPAEDFMDLMARLPWWGALAVGLVSYGILHSIASQPLPAINPKDIGGTVVGSMWRALANIGQWIVPMLCVGGAVVSFVGRRQRSALVQHVTDGGDAAARIDAMSWQDFERLIGEAFRLQGFSVVETGGAGADGGVDLELTKNGERYLVQAKHWRAKQVPVEVVRELAGVMPFRRAVGAYVVTSGTFTGPAKAFAAGRGIELVNGSKLAGLLTQARGSIAASSPSSRRSTRAVERPALAVGETTTKETAAVADPLPCPACGSDMLERTAKKGPNIGQRFWGCSRYPGCRGIRSVASWRTAATDCLLP